MTNESERPEITVRYFVKDSRKDGGSYISKTGSMKRIDAVRGIVVFTDGTEIPVSDMTSVSGEVYSHEKNNC